MYGHGISLSRTVSDKALLHPCVPWCALLSLTCYGTPFCSPKMSRFYQDFPCLAKCCLAFFGGDAKSLAWVFLARRVLPFVRGFFCCLFWVTYWIERQVTICPQVPPKGSPVPLNAPLSPGLTLKGWVPHWKFCGSGANVTPFVPGANVTLFQGRMWPPSLLNGWSWDQSI